MKPEELVVGERYMVRIDDRPEPAEIVDRLGAGWVVRRRDASLVTVLASPQFRERIIDPIESEDEAEFEMRKDQVEVGRVYTVKVSGVISRVRLDAESPHGGWDGVNLETNRRVRVRTAGRLRAETLESKVARANRDAKRENERMAAERAASHERAMEYDPDRCAIARCKREPALEHLGRPLCQEHWEAECAEADPQPTPTAAAAAAPKKPRAPRAPRDPGKLSCVDAAYRVLSETPGVISMDCKQLITAMAEQGLWSSPNGKTPDATLYSALIRSIAKGDGRFVKIGKLFSAVAGRGDA